MTSGTTISDSRVLTSMPNGCAPLYLVGNRFTRTWSGGDLPADFDRKQWLPPHDYHVTFIWTWDPSFLWKVSGQPWRLGTIESCWGALGYPLDLPSAAEIANSNIKAIGRLRTRIEGGEANAAIILGTAHQSLRTIADGATLIYEAVRAVRKGQVKKASRILTKRITILHPELDQTIKEFRRTTIPRRKRENREIRIDKDAAKHWLALQYGWLPILNDIYDAAEMLANQLYAPRRFRRTATDTIQKTDVKVYNGQLKSDRFMNYGTRYVAYYEELPTWMESSGMRNPETLIWELLPWSFVVDWFVPVGDYLEARAFSTRMKGTFVKSVFSSRANFNYRGVTVGFNPVKIPNFSRYVELTRTVSSTLDVPFPRLTALDSVPSWRRCANALALITQAL